MHTSNHVLLHCCLWQLQQGVHEGHGPQALAQSLKSCFCVASLACRQSTAAPAMPERAAGNGKKSQSELLGSSALPAGREDGWGHAWNLGKHRPENHGLLSSSACPHKPGTILCRRLARVISALPVNSTGSTLCNNLSRAASACAQPCGFTVLPVRGRCGGFLVLGHARCSRALT